MATPGLFADPGPPTSVPVPPLRLRRVRLHGVGPAGARFDPLDLDLVAGAGAASRVLLSLANTGGKSTLITLMSSLVVPAARAQIADKAIGDYVLTGDTSHVICEWEDASTGVRTITGTVMEWRDGRRQPPEDRRSPSGLRRRWYLLRTGPGLPSVEDLVFVHDGRRVTLAAFVDALDEVFLRHPAAQGAVTRKQLEWVRLLDERTAIDPVLFGYQMRMNDAESGAEKLLASFDSNDNVVRFFVGALNDERELADHLAKLREYAHIASQRPDLEVRAAFGAEIQPRLEAIAVRSEAAGVARSTLARDRQAAAEFVGAVQQRMRGDRQGLDDLEKEAISAGKHADVLRRQARSLSDIRMQLLLEEARARHTETVDAQGRCDLEAKDAARDARAWTAVQAVVGLDAARQERDAAKAAYDAADRGLGPLRARERTAASALAGRLDALAREADDKVEAADAIGEKAKAGKRQAEGLRRDAQRRIDAIDGDLKQLASDVDRADRARQAGIGAGLLAEDEQPTAAGVRWAQALAAAREDAAEARRQSEAAEAGYDQASGAMKALDQPLVDARRGRDQAHDRLDSYRDDLAGLGRDEIIADLAGGSPEAGETVRRVVDLARAAAEKADVRASEAEAVARDAQEKLAYLDETGTAPAGADALTVVARLDAASIGAVTGLAWVEANEPDPAARPALIAAAPAVASGVVVTDPLRFADALGTLKADPPRLRSPVTVVASTVHEELFDPEGLPSPELQVLLPDRATWDREWATQVRVELQQLADRANGDGATARVAARRHRQAMSACEAFTARWTDSSLHEMIQLAADGDDAVQDLVDRREELVRTAERHRVAARAARDHEKDASGRARSAEGSLRQVAEIEAQLSKVADAEDRRRDLGDRRQQAVDEMDRADRAIAKADSALEAGYNSRAQAVADATRWREIRREVPVEVGVDPGGNLEVLRIAWTSTRDELAVAEAGMVEAKLFERAEKAVADATVRLQELDEETTGLARQLSGTMEASSTAGIAAACRRANARDADANRALARAEQDVEQAAKLVEEREPSSGEQRRNHIDLSTFPEWMPADPSAVPDLVERLDAHAAEVRQRRDTAESEAEEIMQLVAQMEGDIDSFTDTVGLWRHGAAPAVGPFEGTRGAAREEMRRLIGAHDQSEVADRRASDALRDTVNHARALANQPRWRNLVMPLVDRVRSLDDADPVTEAATLSHRVAADTRSAVDDLARLDQHRSILRDGLISTCREQRRLLREVSRASQLRGGLGELAEQPAIKIRFDEAPEDVAAGKLDARIESWALELAANPKRASDTVVRTRWLADAVRDTVIDRARVGPWSIEILKPRIDGRIAYCPPSRIKKEFSGGQVLTLAVLVYCALSRVRAAHRVGGARPPGMLLLDNPFGAASAEALIQMQHQLAAHSGIQLVCATALNDAGVEAAFTGPDSVIVKLRNDGDVRRNLNFLRLRQRIVEGVDIQAAMTRNRDPVDPHNYVDATTYRIEVT